MTVFKTIVIGQRLKTTFLISLTLVVVWFLSYFTVGYFNPTSSVYRTLSPVSRGDSRVNAVALTFDVSWGSTGIDELLSVLEEHQVRATFFISGPWAENHPQLARRIGENHEVGSLGYGYRDLTVLTGSEFHANLLQGERAIRLSTGGVPALFRPPTGEFDDSLVVKVRELGYTPVSYSLDSFDWRGGDAREITDRVLSKVRNGEIIRFQAGDGAPATPEAVAGLIPALTERGYRILPVGELIE